MGFFLADVNTREGFQQRWKENHLSIVKSWGVAVIQFNSKSDGSEGTMKFTGFLPNEKNDTDAI